MLDKIVRFLLWFVDVAEPEVKDKHGNFYTMAEPEYWMDNDVPWTRRVLERVEIRKRFWVLPLWERTGEYVEFDGYELPEGLEYINREDNDDDEKP